MKLRRNAISLILLLVLFSCSSDDGDCKCTGVFTNANIFPETFTVDNVDCETGEPYVSQTQADGRAFVECE